MTDNKQIGLQTESENHKSFFILGVLRIADYQCVDIFKYCRSFFKGNSMFLPVNQILLRIPLKANRFHNYIIIILRCLSISLRLAL